MKKLSQFIEELNEMLLKYGDVEVVNAEWNIEPYADFVESEQIVYIE